MAPILGVISAGVFFDRIGGYTSARTIPVVYSLGMVAIICGLCGIFPDNVYTVSFFLGLQLFGGGFAMPALTGAMLNQVPPSSRALANSIANLVYNLFGYLPAPAIYGLAYDAWGGHWGMAVLQAGTFITLTCSTIAFVSSKFLAITSYRSCLK